MSNTINQQTSVGNAGVGSVGNQTNEQIQAGIKVQIPNDNDADRVASLENRIGDLEKERKGLLAACACSVSICVAFFLGFLFIKSNLPSDISLFVASLVVGFIGALATLVVVKNESQVKEVKNEFRRDVHEIERRMARKIDDSLDDVNHVMEAIGYQALAFDQFESTPALALEYLMRALDHTNKAVKVWEVEEGVIHSILTLKNRRGDEIAIPPDRKRKYREILRWCKHNKKDEVIEFIESRTEPYIPKPNSPWADQSHTTDSSPEK